MNNIYKRVNLLYFNFLKKKRIKYKSLFTLYINVIN